MGSGVILFDRIATIVIAALLIVGGVAAVAWWSSDVTRLDGSLLLGPVVDVTEQAWWPWVLGAAGVVLVLLGLRWLAAHLPDRGVAQLILPGSSGQGRLLVDAGSVADAAAASLEEAPGVRSANARIQRDRGQLVARVSTSIEHEADLRAVARAADAVSGELREVLGRDDLRCRVDVSLVRRSRAMPRVH